MDVKQVAELLNLKGWGIYKMVNQHRLPCVRVGSRLRFSAKAIEEYMKRRTTGPRIVKETNI